MFEFFYQQLAKTFRYESAKKVKDFLRPLKHHFFGKTAIYKAIEVTNDLIHANYGRNVQVAFDVGAAIGETTIPMLKQFPEATMYSFEPLREQYELLRKRTSFSPRVKPYNIGFYNSEGESVFHVVDHRDSSSLLTSNVELEMIRGKEAYTTTVQLRTLDSFLREHPVPTIDLLKIDVEGVEKEVLEGATATLGLVKNVFVEITPSLKGPYSHDYIDTFQILHDAGFSLVGIYGDFFFSRVSPL